MNTLENNRRYINENKEFGKVNTKMVKSFTDKNNLEIILESVKNSLSSSSDSESFYKGIYCLYNNKLSDAKKFLEQAISSTDSIDLAYHEYSSYLGLVEVLLYKSDGGLQRCYHAVNEATTNPELYFNIAYAEHVLGHRQRSFAAIKKGLKHATKFTPAEKFCKCIEKRKKGSRKRTNAAKNIIGRFLRKKKNNYTGKDCEEIFKLHLSKKLDLYIKEMSRKK